MIEVNYQYQKIRDIVAWLDSNIQENSKPSLLRHGGSTIARYVEWRSMDNESWIVRVSGQPPKITVEIKDDEMKMLFILRWL